jgi:TATA-box binding protein (TBP) (component of TFIID and TFIIIB)
MKVKLMVMDPRTGHSTNVVDLEDEAVKTLPFTGSNKMVITGARRVNSYEELVKVTEELGHVDEVEELDVFVMPAMQGG